MRQISVRKNKPEITGFVYKEIAPDKSYSEKVAARLQG
jgi:hypothetical protein